jgi:hypothetical protein
LNQNRSDRLAVPGGVRHGLGQVNLVNAIDRGIGSECAGATDAIFQKEDYRILK